MTDPAIVEAQSFPELLTLRATRHPNKTLYTFVREDDSHQELTYGSLHAAALRIANAILLRFQPGDRVLLLYPPGADYITAFFGCLAAGVIPVPCYPPTNARNSGRIVNILTDCGAALILTSPGGAAKWRPLLEFEHWLEAGIDVQQDVELQASDNRQHSVPTTPTDGRLSIARPQAVAFLQYTSGSTAAPKGVRVTHRNLMANSAQIQSAFGLTPESIGASWLPPYHDMGLIGGLLQMAYAGCHTYVLSPAYFLQQPVRWLRLISAARATHAGAPNFAYELCTTRITDAHKAQLDLSSWSVAFCGAEPIRAQTLERFYEAFKSCGFRREALTPCYGLAEATLLVTASRSLTGPVLASALELTQPPLSDPTPQPDTFSPAPPPRSDLPPSESPSPSDLSPPIPPPPPNPALPADQPLPDQPPPLPSTPSALSPSPSLNPTAVSSGQPVTAQRVEIVDPDRCIRLPEGTLGEIWVSGESVADGYWGKPRDSNETAATFRARLQGDPYSPDFLRTGDLGMLRGGELFVAGRLKDVIILGGRNIYPQDVEAASSRSHPALRADGAAAFSIADSEGVERLVVAQELDFRRQPDDTLFGHIAAAVFDETGVQPEEILLLKAGAVPRTSSGKIRRNQTRIEFESGGLPILARRHRQRPASSPQETPRAAKEPSPRRSAAQIEAWLKAQLADRLQLDPHTVEADQPFAYHGVDSVQAVDIGTALGTWLQQSLSPTLLWDYPTISSLARHLGAKSSATSPSARPVHNPNPGPASDNPSHPPSVSNSISAPIPLSNSTPTTDPIAIIGLSCRFPGAPDPEAFWQLLITATDAIREVPPARYAAGTFSDAPGASPHTRYGGFLDQVDTFDPHFFGIAPREAPQIDPQQRLVLEVAWEALENASLAPARLAGSQTGVYVGLSSRDYEQMRTSAGLDLYAATGAAPSIAANRLSYLLDLRGPSLVVDTACSSSLVAVHLACQSLRNHEVNLALAGGVGLMLSNRSSMPFAAAGLLAQDGRCKAFDSRANGYVRGEGCGVLVLKRLTDALRDGDTIRAVIAGSAVNQDGRSNGLAAPNGNAQVAVIRQALAQANVSPAQISYIEAHGTGTALGDPIELNALKEVLLHERPDGSTCAIGSVKTNIGHLEAAAGIAGLIKTVLALERHTIPPNLHYQTLNPNCSLDDTALTIPVTSQSWTGTNGTRHAGVSSFGFGGTIAHLIATEAPAAAARRPAQPPSLTSAVEPSLGSDLAPFLGPPFGPAPAPSFAPPLGRPLPHWPYQLLIWSAKSTSALETMTDRLAQTLATSTPERLADIACTLQLGRNTFNHRRMLVTGQDPAAAAQAMFTRDRRSLHERSIESPPGPVVFMFPGQGAQHVRMAYPLYQHVSSFRAQVDTCLEQLEPALRRQIGAVLLSDTPDEALEQQLNQTALAQPALFIIEYALAQLWIEWGIQPRALIGHSLGEYVAACVAGVFSLKTALALVCTRARLMQTAQPGAMTSVALPEQGLTHFLSTGVELAAVNAPERCVVAGNFKSIDELEQRLLAQGIPHQRLRTSHAFHSASMDPIVEEYAQAVAEAPRKPPRIPYLSNVTGTWITAAEAVDPQYWARQLREPVRFSQGLEALAQQPDHVLIEVGPGQTLTRLTRQHRACASLAVFPSLSTFSIPQSPSAQQLQSPQPLPPVQARDADLHTLLNTLGHLWLAGQPVDWSALQKNIGARRIALPTYPFDRERYWVSSTEPEPLIRATMDKPPSPTSLRPTPWPTTTSAPIPQTSTSPNPTIPPAVTHSPARRAQIQSQLRTLVATLLQTAPERIDPLAPLLELGADSLVLVQAVRNIETQFGVTLTIRQLFEELTTLAAISAYLESQQPAPTFAPVPSSFFTSPPTTVPLHFAALSSSSMPAPLQPPTAAAIATPPPAPPDHAAQSQGHPSPITPPPLPTPAKLDPYRSLNPQQKNYLNNFIATFTQRTRGSKILTEKNRPILADYRAQAGFRFSANDPLLPLSLKELFYPITADRSEGARLWDVDGNEYVDLTMGFGAHLFGHQPPFILQALQQQMSQGLQLGPQSPLAGEVAELVQQLSGMERVAFCNSGTEAVMLAVRLARTATGRPKIAMFTGSYHGWADGQLVGANPDSNLPATAMPGTVLPSTPSPPDAASSLGAIPVSHASSAMPLAPGLQPGVHEQALVLDYGADNALQMIRAHAHELAAVLVEPVQGRRPELQPRPFLQQLRALTHELGIALIFDEMITGFRLHPGGAQAWFDVRADIVTYGKALGGGMPLGIVAGTATYLNGVDGGVLRHTAGAPAVPTTFFAGTFSKHPLTLAATRAVLQKLIQEGPALQQGLNQRTGHLVDRLNRLFATEQLPMQIVQCGSLFRLNTLRNLDLFCYHLVAHGVYVWEGRNMYLSTAHTDADLDHIVHAFESSIRDLRQGGFLPQAPAATPLPTRDLEPIRFSLSFFGHYDSEYRDDKYRLLFDSARFADQHDFTAVWLPERHFHAFGGLSPNPVVLCAALARETKHLQLRAGSVVLPLHHPVRVAEEWSMVDNLSDGRVGIALASGWHPNDFVLAPQNFGTHRERMFEALRQVQALWRGEAIHLPDGAGKPIPIRLFPSPKQPELPVWITIVNNPDTYRRAGEIGAGILTNLMGQTLEELRSNIERYRLALDQHGHPPSKGRVTVLLHTFLDESAERAHSLAREPFIRYLRTSIGLFQNMVNSLGLQADVASMTEDDRDYLLSVAYERYVQSSALIGSPKSVRPVVEQLQQLGVDEIGCFIDFGVDTPAVLSSLPQLDDLRRSFLQTPPIPLSAAQLRLWLVQQHFAGQQTAYNMPFALQLQGPLNAGPLQSAFQALLRRHDILRTRFPVLEEGAEPVQLIDADTQISIPVIECDPTDCERRAREHAEYVFNLAEGPLLKVTLLRLSPVEHVLLLNLHEIISDGWSMAILTRDIQQLYGAQLTGHAPSLPELPIQYASYARQQRQLDLTEHRHFWSSKLAGYESVLPLPYDHLAPNRGAWRVGIVRHVFPADLALQVSQFSRTHRVTPFMTLLAAALVVLHRYTGRTDLCVGTTVAGRDLLPVEELIGYFVNIMPLRMNLTGDPTAAELVQRVRATALEAFEHQVMPFDQILSNLQLPRDDGHTPLVPVMVRYQNHRDSLVNEWPGGLQARRLPTSQGTAKCELDLEFFGKGPELGVLVEYATDLFEPTTIERLLQHQRRVLEQLVSQPALPLSRFSLLTPDESRLQELWNTAQTAPLPPQDIVELFERQVRLSPDSPACMTEEETLSYRALNTRANHIAHALRERGVSAEVRVAVFMERTPDFLAALLGIFKAGGVYVPLDPHYPPLYLQRILAQVEPCIMLTAAALQDRLCEFHTGDALNADSESLRSHPDQNPQILSLPNQLACIAYTSGSTGDPRGVMVPHRQILNWLHALWARSPFTQDDVVAQKTPSGFSVSLKELLAGLLAGAPQVLIPDAVTKHTPAFAAALSSWRVTRLNIVPSHLAALLDQIETTPEVLQSLRHCVTAGEPLSSELAARFATLLPQARLWNNYGCTELNDVTYCDVSAGRHPWGRVAMGDPIPGSSVYVLEETLRQVPVGVVGELCVSSRGLSRGYWANPTLTAERFVPNPYATAPGERLLRTGDLVRRRSDGSLEYLGREDFQVKIRGQRVDSLLVERTLSEHSQIAAAVVLGIAVNAGGAGLAGCSPVGISSPTTGASPSDNSNPTARTRSVGTSGAIIQLVAYYTTATNTPVNAELLRAYLADRLPSFMVPTLYIPLAELPRLPNGKLNRLALPAPAPHLLARQAYTAPTTPTESTLTAIWSDLLGIPADRISTQDNFFALGGHSLLATQVVARVQTALSKKLTVQTLFEAATISKLAAQLDQSHGVESPSLPPLVPVPRTGKEPLSFAQQRMWFLVQLEPRSTYFNMFQAVSLPPSPDLRALQLALTAVITRHEILRTRFPADEQGLPYQRITNPPPVSLPQTDLSSVPEANQDSPLRACLEHERNQLFDVANGPLLRARLVKRSESNYLLAITVHHLIFDGLSIDLFTRELLTAYQAFATADKSAVTGSGALGDTVLAPPSPIQYADYAAWQRVCVQNAALEEQLAYWTKHLEGAPALLELPTDRQRPAVQTYRGNVHDITLSPALTQAVSAFCVNHDSTMYVTLLSTLVILLSRYSRQHDIVVGTMIADRSQPALIEAIGYFVNAVPLRVTVAPEHSALTLIKQVKQVVLGAIAHQHLPFEYLVERLNPPRSSAYPPIYQVAFISRDFQADELNELAQTSQQSYDTEGPGATVHDLMVTARQTHQGIELRCTYNTDLFDPETVARWATHYVSLVEALVKAPNTRVAGLSMLSKAERELMLVTWNDTTTSSASTASLKDLLEAQAARTPAQTAVVFGNTEVTYAQLHAQANRLAHHLRQLGVGPDVLVGICLERSVEMIVGVLGVVKAGGAYVPLDPAYPPERLAYMLSDAGPAVVLTQQRVLATLPPTSIPVICLDLQDSWGTRSPPETIPNTTHPANLAYIIYTSGSTGKPKGTAVHQAGFLNLLCWFVSRFEFSPADRTLLFSSFSFDLTQKNLFAPLLTGGQLHLPPEGYAPAAACAYIRTHTITSLNCAPSAFYPLLAQRTDHDLHSLRRIFLGGEPIQAQLLHDAFSKASTRPTVYNTYGPTEASDVVSWFPWDPALTRADIPIGRPIDNIRLYILDPHLQPVPVGLVGQLHIAGIGLARGYFNRPGLTAERFIPNPFGAPGSRLYQTGDLARYRLDGSVEYLGRVDQQVKIRGLRVELGEIEATLTAQPSVREAAVVTREDTSGAPRLVAYIVPHDSDEVEPATLRTALLRALPEYMVPSHFVTLSCLPVTANGKLDRKALPRPGENTLAQQAYVAPHSPTEHTLLALWSELLRLPADRIGVHDSFFALGGHSLLALQLQHAISTKLQKSLDLTSFFKSPNIRELAATLDSNPGRSLLVPLQKETSGRPVFCIHPVGGEVVCYLTLARELGRHGPVYALQSPEVAGLSPPFGSLTAMVTAYAEAIIQAQPEGPYDLLGWSTGGMLAMAVAATLEARGKTVGYVGLLDSHPLQPLLGDATPARLSFAAILTVLSSAHPEILTTDKLKAVEQAALEVTHNPSQEQLLALLQTATGVTFDPAHLDPLERPIEITRHHLTLLADYSPKSVRAPLHLCLANDSHIDHPNHNSRSPNDTIDQVAGDHYTMLAEPHAHALANLITARRTAPTRRVKLQELHPGPARETRTTCLLLHGLGDSSAIWYPIVPTLGAHFRVLSADLLGHGDSGWDPEARYCVADHLEAVLTEIRGQNLTELALVGHSLGAQIALHIAAEHPQYVSRLVLADFGPGRSRESCEAVLSAVRASIRHYPSVEDYTATLLEHRPMTPLELAQHLAKASLRPSPTGGFVPKTDPAVTNIDLDAVSDERLWAMLKAVRCPTLIMRGSGSAVLRDNIARRMSESLRDGQYHVVPAAGHSIMTDNPYECAAVISTFLRGGRAQTALPGSQVAGSWA